MGELPHRKVSMSIKITLSEEDQQLAIEVGDNRYAVHSKRGTAERFNHKGRSAEKEYESIGAEIAVARALDLTWEDRPIVQDRKGDIIDGLQVRSTKYSSGRLLIYDTDNNDHDFFLVTGEFPNYIVKGWINCGEGKKIGTLRQLVYDRPPQICVEQEDLNPVEAYERVEIAS
jgi:hypothetical protein